MTKTKTVLALVTLFALYCLASTLDYNEQVEYNQHACKMVEQGYWSANHCK